MIFIVLISIFILLYAIHYHIHNNDSAKIFNKIPGPAILPVVGNGLDFVTGQGNWFPFQNIFETLFNCRSIDDL